MAASCRSVKVRPSTPPYTHRKLVIEKPLPIPKNVAGQHVRLQLVVGCNDTSSPVGPCQTARTMPAHCDWRCGGAALLMAEASDATSFCCLLPELMAGRRWTHCTNRAWQQPGEPQVTCWEVEAHGFPLHPSPKELHWAWRPPLANASCYLFFFPSLLFSPILFFYETLFSHSCSFECAISGQLETWVLHPRLHIASS